MRQTSGDYYVWHCAWCDSTNHTEWTRMATERLACGACHHQAGVSAEEYPVFIQAHLAVEAGVHA